MSNDSRGRLGTRRPEASRTVAVTLVISMPDRNGRLSTGIWAVAATGSPAASATIQYSNRGGRRVRREQLVSERPRIRLYYAHVETVRGLLCSRLRQQPGGPF